MRRMRCPFQVARGAGGNNSGGDAIERTQSGLLSDLEMPKPVITIPVFRWVKAAFSLTCHEFTLSLRAGWVKSVTEGCNARRSHFFRRVIDVRPCSVRHRDRPARQLALAGQLAAITRR